jgi:hypothetical protein
MQLTADERRPTDTKKKKKTSRIESSEKTCNYSVYKNLRKSTGKSYILNKNITINKHKEKAGNVSRCPPCKNVTL